MMTKRILFHVLIAGMMFVVSGCQTLDERAAEACVGKGPDCEFQYKQIALQQQALNSQFIANMNAITAATWASIPNDYGPPR